MAHESLRSHLSGSVPISIVVHLVILLVLVVIPLANVVLPIPVMSIPSYVLAEALPVPPAPRPRPPVSTASPAPSNSGAPTTAPDKLEPERVVTPPSVTADTSAIGGVDFGGETGGVGTTTIPTPPPAPEQPKPQGPIRVAELPVSPRKTVDVRPIYPDIARQNRVEGIVILEAVLDTSGHVTQLKVLRSVPLLDQAALDAVKQWRYAPSMYYGKPVSVLMTITVRFTLQQ